MQNDFEIKRHKDCHADQRAHIARSGEGGAANDRISQHSQWEKWLARGYKTPDEEAPQDRGQKEQYASLRRNPLVASSSPGQRKQKSDRRRHHKQGTDDIEAVLARMKWHSAEHAGRHAKCNKPER